MNEAVRVKIRETRKGFAFSPHCNKLCCLLVILQSSMICCKKGFSQCIRELASSMVRQCKSHHWHLSAAYIQGIKAIEVMGTQAPWRQEKEHFMNPQTVIYSLLSLMPVCTHEFPCYLMCLCDIKGTVSENRAVFIMYFIQKLLSFKQVHEKQSCLSWCMFSWLSLYLKHSPCYHSEIKELLIAYVFKYGLKMIMKQDYLK